MSLDASGELVVVEALVSVLTDLLEGSEVWEHRHRRDHVLELAELRIGHETNLELIDGAILPADHLTGGRRQIGELLATELERRGYEIRRIP